MEDHVPRLIGCRVIVNRNDLLETSMLETIFHTPGVPQPRHSLVWVRRVKKEKNKKVGLLYLPNNLEDFEQAEVLAFGPGFANNTGTRDLDTEDLEVGMVVLIRAQKTEQHGPHKVVVNHTMAFDFGDEKLEMMDQRDILSIVRTAQQERERKAAERLEAATPALEAEVGRLGLLKLAE